MTDWILDNIAKIIIVKRPNIFLTVEVLDYFACWFGFRLLPDLLRPDSSKLIISGIVRLVSCGGERGMSSENQTLCYNFLLGLLVDAVLINVLPSPSWDCSGFTTSRSAPSKSGMYRTKVSLVGAPLERPLCSPVDSSGLGSFKCWESRYCWEFGMWVGGWYWFSQELQTEDHSGNISSELRSTKPAQFEGTVPFLICNTVVKWSSKTKWNWCETWPVFGFRTRHQSSAWRRPNHGWPRFYR